MRQRAVLISGSPSPTSKSRALLEHARARLVAQGLETTLIDLGSLPAEGLLGRRRDERVQTALDAVGAAQLLVAGSPVYRATYSGLLKVFFDLLPADCLAGKLAIPILSGGSRAHQLALDHGFRPLVASLGGLVTAGVYGSDSQFTNGPEAALLASVDRAVDEALAWLGAGSVTFGA